MPQAPRSIRTTARPFLYFALAFRPGAGVLLWATILPPLVARRNAEERLPRAHFGPACADYCARVSRRVPGVY
jgi:protein-S-isoprenylcysteine O-methyltransferase Ste14